MRNKRKLICEEDSELVKAVRTRAVLFTYDNFHKPTEKEFLVIETAMMVGVAIGLSESLKEEGI